MNAKIKIVSDVGAISHQLQDGAVLVVAQGEEICLYSIDGDLTEMSKSLIEKRAPVVAEEEPEGDPE